MSAKRKIDFVASGITADDSHHPETPSAPALAGATGLRRLAAACADGQRRFGQILDLVFLWLDAAVPSGNRASAFALVPVRSPRPSSPAIRSSAPRRTARF